MQSDSNGFIRLIKNPFKVRIFLLSKLPAAFFTGLKIEEVSKEKCAVSVPYKWFNKNPFRSTYFASLAMAAELSTGALAMANVYGQKPPVSMLVTGLQAEYYKKATAKTIFTCNDGQKFIDAVSETKRTGEGQLIQAVSYGVNEQGEAVAKFVITWSLKAKSK